ncbi:hypothetical protein C8Q75DRAFT_95882 [Abortiporus biennis]|nr:hypothetical protein C8Q75DRAFT_95882 [Abortiporus biennis]
MPSVTHSIHETNVPSICHVNLMMDCFLANANINDLRAVVRATLATSPPTTTSVFVTAARKRLERSSATKVPSPIGLFNIQGETAVPGKALNDALIQARSLYGVGMGFASLRCLTMIVGATVGLRWEEDGEMADTLAAVDADVSQAIQSCKEEVAANRVTDLAAAKAAVASLEKALDDSYHDTQSWGGEYPFEKGSISVRYWSL